MRGLVVGSGVVNIMDGFCKRLERPAVVVLDNASIYKSKAVEAKREEWDRRGMTLYFLSTYSPELNLIEILWRKIKYEWIPCSAYESIFNLRSAIRNIIDLFGSNEYRILFSN